MESLYVLQLADGKYYVGKTNDVKRRIEEHTKGAGSEWTRLHRPVKVVETRRLKDEHDENNTTKDYMNKYGVDNVRGGSYSQVSLPSSYRKTLEAELRGNSNACFKCGQRGHFARDCHGIEVEEEEEDDEDQDDEDQDDEDQDDEDQDDEDQDDEDQDDEDQDDEDQDDEDQDDAEDEDTCGRCGRSNHYDEDCYAYTHVSGKYIGKPSRDTRTEWSDDDSD